MHTRLDARYLNTPEGQEADAILRSCVHCGFCAAACPTYQLLGDELDGPRGRIYLIKEVLEGNAVSASTRLHLDRCLTCRACETTCPSGVRYGRLLDIGRGIVERVVPRGLFDSTLRVLLRRIIPYPSRLAPLLRTGHWLRPLLPRSLRNKLPVIGNARGWPGRRHARRMLVLRGCIQGIATPATNAATAHVLDRLGIELVQASDAGCCGALSHHLSAHDETLDFARRNIDAWWPEIEQGAEAIVITASGCGAMVKDYGELLKHDTDYAHKASRVSALASDIAEVLLNEPLPAPRVGMPAMRVAFHSPCTLQHGQKLNGVVETILARVGFQLTAVADAHLCCGSAGTYSLLQPQLSGQLLENKLDALQQDTPDVIATANIGCQLHLASRASRPVKHWIELLYERIG